MRIATLSNSLALALLATVPVLAAGRNFTAQVSGPLTSQTVSATVTPDDADMGKSGNYYVAAFSDKYVFFFNGASWVPYTGGSFPTVASGALAAKTLPIVSHFDLSSLTGLTIYAGYGSSDADMASNAKFAPIYTVPQRRVPTFKLSPQAITVNAGSTLAIDPILTTFDGSPVQLAAGDLSLSTSDYGVVQLNGGTGTYGGIKAMGGGTATIIAKSKSTGMSTLMSVTVIGPSYVGNYIGSYTGTYTGSNSTHSDSGTWTFTVSADNHSVTGLAYSTLTGAVYALSGQVSASGAVSLSTSPNSIFSSFSGQILDGTVTGNPAMTTGSSGSVTGHPSATPLQPPSCSEITTGSYSGSFKGDDTGLITATISAPTTPGGWMGVKGSFVYAGITLPVDDIIYANQFYVDFFCTPSAETSNCVPLASANCLTMSTGRLFCGGIFADIQGGTISGRWDLGKYGGSLLMTKSCP